MIKEEIRKAFEAEKAERQNQQLIHEVTGRLIKAARSEWKNNGWQKFADYGHYDTVDAHSILQLAAQMDPDAEALHQAFSMPAVENLTMDLDWILRQMFGSIAPKLTVAAKKSSLPAISEEVADIGTVTLRCLTEYYVKTTKHTVALIVQACVEYGDGGRLLNPFLIANKEVKLTNTLSKGLPTVVSQAYGATQLLLKFRPEVVSCENTGRVIRSETQNASPDYRDVPIIRYRVDSGYSEESDTRYFKCPSWGVSGHYRHLKSGKVVWVKPYRKGVERDNNQVYSPKNYAPPSKACS